MLNLIAVNIFADKKVIHSQLDHPAMVIVVSRNALMQLFIVVHQISITGCFHSFKRFVRILNMQPICKLQYFRIKLKMGDGASITKYLDETNYWDFAMHY
jgi:hypothetical protein